MKDYDEYLRSADSVLAAGSKVDNDLERMAQGREDRQFEKFKKRIGHEPEQVMCGCVCVVLSLVDSVSSGLGRRPLHAETSWELRFAHCV